MTSRMPEPTGKYAKVPANWPPQTWGAHLARLEFMDAMGQGHASITDPAWHVKKYRQKILSEIAENVEALSLHAGGTIADPAVVLRFIAKRIRTDFK